MRTAFYQLNAYAYQLVSYYARNRLELLLLR